MSIVLPMKKVESSRKNPKRIVIYSKPKVGKTSALAELDNTLLLDFEKGSDYVDALKIKIDSLTQLREVGTAIIEAGRPYLRIAVDTVTAIEDLVLPLAKKLYRATSMGKNFDYAPDPNDPTKVIDLNSQTVLKLPNGAGYLYLREAFFSVLDYIETLVPEEGTLILLGHLKDKMIDDNGKEVSSVELDLSGKIKSLVCSKADAIGLLHRKKNQTLLTFKTSNEVVCGARPDHLKNKEFVLSELIDDKLITYWDKIFI